MIALCFDTETSGLVENVTIKNDKLPEMIEFAGILVDLDTGAIQHEYETLIKPRRPLSDKPAPGDKQTIEQITGITNKALENASSFNDLAPKIISLIENAPMVIAHNCSFDVEVVSIEAARIGRLIQWPPQVCSVEQSIHLLGKRLTLSALHEHLFGIRFADAHRALTDTKALVRCCVELRKRGEL